VNPYENIKKIIVKEVQTQIKESKKVELGKIDPAYSSGKPSIVFDGENQASVKQYPYLSSYFPNANDRIMVVRGVVVGDLGGESQPIIRDVTIENPTITGNSVNISVDDLKVDAPNGTIFMDKVDMRSDLNVDGRITATGGIQVGGEINANDIYGALNHTGGYMKVSPYGSSYDDGSMCNWFYDGNQRELQFWNSGSGYTSLGAEAFNTISLEEYKQDIKVWGTDILDTYRNGMDLYRYRMKKDVDRGVLDDWRQGLVIGEGYKTPNHIVNDQKTGVSLYDFTTSNAKAIQELIKELDSLKNGVNQLKGVV